MVDVETLRDLWESELARAGWDGRDADEWDQAPIPIIRSAPETTWIWSDLHLGDGRSVTLLDGDLVRKNLSSELGFSKEHRGINIRRIGYVASEITKNGGIAVCAPIAPYDAVRKDVRTMIEPVGGFMLVHVDTPLQVCEQRDRKGLYAKARAGIIKEFTGISDPYESPADAELTIDTTSLTPDEAAQRIILYLEKAGYVGVAD